MKWVGKVYAFKGNQTNMLKYKPRSVTCQIKIGGVLESYKIANNAMCTGHLKMVTSDVITVLSVKSIHYHVHVLYSLVTMSTGLTEASS